MSCTIKWLLITVLAFLGWSLYARSMKLISWPEHQWCYLSFLLGTCKGPAASRPRCQWGVLQAPLCSPSLTFLVAAPSPPSCSLTHVGQLVMQVESVANLRPGEVGYAIKSCAQFTCVCRESSKL